MMTIYQFNDIAPEQILCQHGVHRCADVLFRLNVPVQNLFRRKLVKIINTNHCLVTSLSLWSSVSISCRLNW